MRVWRRARAMIERALSTTFASFRRPVILRSTYAEIVAQGCTRTELLQLRHVADEDLPRVARAVGALLRCTPQPARTKVLCFGSRASPKTVKSVFRLPNGAEAAGIWSAEARLIVVRVASAPPIRSALVHEFAHALIDHFAGRFPYPFAILEGYATLIENMVVRGAPAYAPMSAGQTAAQSCEQGSAMTVEALLRFDWPQEASDAHIDYDSFFHNALCFMGFLGELGSGHGRLVKEMLYALRQEQADTWDKVYAWLLRSAQLSAAELEAQFRIYVSTGHQTSY